MDDEIIYTATYHNKTYTFTDACAPLIFSYGIYHVIDKEGRRTVAIHSVNNRMLLQ